MSDREVDQQLVERAQRGDKKAFELLVGKYQRKLARLLSRFIRDAAEVEDVTQEAFIKAYRALPTFRGDSAFYTWLYRIVTNVTIDTLRRKGMYGEVEFGDQIALGNVDPASRTTPSAAPLPHSRLDQKEIRQRIDEAIDELSPGQRAVIVLRELEDLSYHEIAEILDCSIGTVMSRLFYARKKLQTLLRDVYANL